MGAVVKSIDTRLLIFLLLITQGNPVLKLLSIAFIRPEALKISKANSRPVLFYASMIFMSLVHGAFYIGYGNYAIALLISTSFWIICLLALLMNLDASSRQSPEKLKNTIVIYAYVIIAFSVGQYILLCISTSTINPFRATQAAGDHIRSIFSSANNNMVVCVLLAVFFYYEKKAKLAIALAITAVTTSFMGGLLITIFATTFSIFMSEKSLKNKFIISASIIFFSGLLFLFSRENINYALFYINKALSFDSPPFKVISFIQTIEFWLDSPKNFLFGAGSGNFSSRTAFLVSGDYIDWYPSNLIYLSKDFINNHFWVWTYDFPAWDNRSSTANQPMSAYNQIIGEYGLLGVISFVLLYVLSFTKSWKSTPCIRVFIFFMAGIFLFDYWFEFLDVIIVFELLALYELSKLRLLKTSLQKV